MIQREDVGKLVGQKFIQFRNGMAYGCLAPMYEILPEMNHLQFPVSEDVNMLQHFKETCKEISLSEMQYGDLIILRLPKNQWHLMVYLGEGKAIHCTEHIETEIINYDKYFNRIKGVFRYVPCS